MGCRCILINLHSRLLVAAMHFNENFGRAQATTKSGKERIKIAFPKLLRTIELCTNEDYKPTNCTTTFSKPV